jgi:hypothetical protein
MMQIMFEIDITVMPQVYKTMGLVRNGCKSCDITINKYIVTNLD